MQPALLLDVDGPLNPYMASNSTLPYSEWRKAKLASGWAQARVRLSRKHGPMLWDFAERHGMELLWATMWGPWAANQFIGSEIRLPPIEGVDFESLDMDYVRKHGQQWKFGYVLEQLGDRPLAWFDDEFQVEHVARDWFLGRRRELGAATLLVDISPHVGITEDDLKPVATWLEGGNPMVWANARTEQA